MALVDFFYSVRGFSPPAKEGQMGGYGFVVYLDKEIALQAMNIELPERVAKNMQESARLITGAVHGKQFEKEGRYSFHGSSALLLYCQTFGNACDLGIEGMKISRLEEEAKIYKESNKSDEFPVEYGPHNVDTAKQAYALLSMWTGWIEIVDALIKR